VSLTLWVLVGVVVLAVVIMMILAIAVVRTLRGRTGSLNLHVSKIEWK